MTIRRGTINQFQESQNRLRDFRRALILGEYRIEEALSRFRYHPLKRPPLSCKTGGALNHVDNVAHRDSISTTENGENGCKKICPQNPRTSP